MISEFRSTIRGSREEAFAYHTRPGAFGRLTPPWESVELVEHLGGIEDGARVTLKLQKGPISLTWKLGHQDYIENEQFVDVQIEGPFEAWRHLHRFSDGEPGSFIMEDEVEWEPPLGRAGDLLGGPMVRSDLERMFAFRHRRLADDLALLRQLPRNGSLRIGISGASGLIGTHLSHLIGVAGHTAVPLVRGRARAEAAGGIYFSPSAGEVDAEGLRTLDAVVHLAGEPIQAVRWTSEKKRAIRESRVNGTELLANTMAGLHNGPETLVCASAVGFYGGRGTEILDESSSAGRGFLAETVEQWEGATRRAEGAGLRVVKIRTGLVISPAGGALPKMLWAFKSGLAGRIGTGKQYVPWVDLDDITGIYLQAVLDPEIRGVLNGTAPNPVTNAAFTDILGRVLNRPTVVPVPSLAVKAMLGEMGTELLLQGQRARPRRTLETGYDFRFDNLEASLRHQLGR